MAKVEHYFTQFEEGKFYHVYNRAIDKQPLFKNDANYDFFLKRFAKYLSPVLDVYAFCLLNNHFHFLIKIKERESFKGNSANCHEFVSKQFKLFFQSYAMAFNSQHKRVGSLFQTPFKRALVNDETYFTHLIFYIHSNPQKHKLTNDFREWKWSSYKGIISSKSSKLMKEEVIEWFGSKEDYIKFHEINLESLNDKLIIED